MYLPTQIVRANRYDIFIDAEVQFLITKVFYATKRYFTKNVPPATFVKRN